MGHLQRAAGLMLAGVLVFETATATAPAHAEESYDIVLANGRVMDPESGLDAVRHVGVSGGRIGAISEQALSGKRIIDARGLVVAPGFIDLHNHAQDLRGSRFQVMDGVTTALDMEIGAYPVAEWYASRVGKSLNHFGVAVGHLPARIKLKHDREVGHPPTNPDWRKASVSLKQWAYEGADEKEISRLEEILEDGLNDGALGIGLAVQYTPAASRKEILRIFELAARTGTSLYVHARYSGNLEEKGGVDAIQELLANVAATGASLHVFHVTSNGLRHTPLILSMIEGARARGFDVSVEAYPYPAASTALQSAYFDPGWQQRYGISYGDIMFVETGERLTASTFETYREKGGLVVIFMIPEAIVEAALRSPFVIVASDGLPFDTGREHPRGAGTFARVLGRYVREEKLMSLMDALRKMTLMPAERLEGFVPAMRRKGRLRTGADADIVVFDPDTVIDRATFEEPMQSSEGFVHVLVDGVFVVQGGALRDGVAPGRPLRR